jgi:hypothetical protein
MSTQINNIEGLSVNQIKSYVNQGGKFVLFPYTISFVVMTLKRSSDIYFIKPGESTTKYSAGFIIMNLLLGWWGIPWGPVYTIGALIDHIRGGKDITQEVMSHLIQNDPNAAVNAYNIPGANNNTPSQTGSSTYNIPNSNSGNSSSSPYNIQ